MNRANNISIRAIWPEMMNRKVEVKTIAARNPDMLSKRYLPRQYMLTMHPTVLKKVTSKKVKGDIVPKTIEEKITSQK